MWNGGWVGHMYTVKSPTNAKVSQDLSMVEVLLLKARLMGLFGLFKISVTKCDFLVDLETGRETEREPDFAKRTKEWEVLLKKPFLDAERLVM